MSLRRRLITTMIVLVALGLAAVAIVTTSSLHSYLYGRVDEQLNTARQQVQTFVLRSDAHGVPISAAEIQSRVDPEVYVQILDSAGNVVVSRPSGSRFEADPAPKLPKPLPASPPMSSTGARQLGRYHPVANSVNVPSVPAGGPEYRLQASPLPGGTLVVATRLDAVNATLDSLEDVQLAVSLGVVAALVVLLAVLVRRGLRPLEDMAEEADVIAAGDLSRRVRPADTETEIGRLGRALNGMLSQIEAAFAQRTMSEDRLRRFLADASHELRTPLTSIRGYAELLQKGAIADEAGRDRALSRIEGEAAWMGDLVEDLLTLARLGEGPEPERYRIDLAAVVADAVADARAVDSTRAISLEAPAAVAVDADEQRLGQLIHNLLGNAMAHTPAGTPVEVTVVGQAGRAVLRVRDHGPGMSVEQASRVFDRFYRGNATRADGGSGLGLFIVAAVTRSLGGHVTVDTAPGEGATFEVVLPLYGAAPGAGAGDGAVAGAGDAEAEPEPEPGRPAEAEPGGDTATTEADHADLADVDAEVDADADAEVDAEVDADRGPTGGTGRRPGSTDGAPTPTRAEA